MSCFTAVLVAPREGILRAERDWLGGRTAYWATQGDSVGISTSCALLSRLFGGDDFEDSRYMTDLFAGRHGEPGRTAFRGISELLPGRQLSFGKKRLVTSRTEFDAAEPQISRTDPVGQFRDLFQQAVSDCISPAPEKTAVMLSGGMDSGPVAASAARLRRFASKSPFAVSWKLTRFPEADETRWIQQVADYIGLETRFFEGSEMLPFNTLDIQHIAPDFPIYNAFRPLVLGTYRRASQNGADIILNACGGDMSYPRSNWVLHDQVRRMDLSGAARTLSLLASRRPGATANGRRNLRYLGGRLIGRRNTLRVPAWLTNDAAKQCNEMANGHPDAPEYRHPLHANQLLTSAHDTALENAFSCRYGLDRRDPFQSPRLVRFMLKLPFSFSHRNGVDKWIMRQAMRGQLPEEIRLKCRTGLLNSFFEAGFNRNRAQIREFLLSGHREWEAWVRRDYIEAALRAEQTSPEDQLLVTRCIGHALWHQTLRS